VCPDLFADPPALRRIARPIRIFQLALIGLLIPLCWGNGRKIFWCFMVIVGVGCLAEIFLSIRLLLLRRRVKAAGFRACPSCGRALSRAHRQQESCARCGTPCAATEAEKIWRQAMQS